MKGYLTEFIGTFFLVLTIGLAVLSGSPLAPLAIGASLMVMVYMGGHISGGHFNPAVTTAVWLRGKLPASQVIPYWIAQILGSLVAAFVVHITTGHTFAPAPSPTASSLQVLIIEVLYTFALALVVLNTATAKGTSGNSFYGLAIGFTVMAGAFAMGGVSGAMFNPAVAVGVSVMRLSPWPNLWIYLVAEVLGGLVAGLTFKFINPEDK